MFRNALRQSTRAVGAISATSRVAAVSYPSRRRIDLNIIEKGLKGASIHLEGALEAQLSILRRAAGRWRALRAVLELPFEKVQHLRLPG